MKITVQTISMKLCNHCWSIAIGDIGGWRSIWLTAGPPARSRTAGAAKASVVARSAEQAGGQARRGSHRHHRCCHVSLLFVVQALAPSSGRAAPKRLSAARSSSASARRSSGPDEAADRDPLALARELDQRALAVRRLDPDPCRRELDLVGAPAERAFDAEAAGREGHALAVAGVARVDQERRADRRGSRSRRTAGPASRRATRTRRRSPATRRRARGRRRPAGSASSSSCDAAAIAPSRRPGRAALPKRSDDAAGAGPGKAWKLRADILLSSERSAEAPLPRPTATAVSSKAGSPRQSSRF